MGDILENIPNDEPLISPLTKQEVLNTIKTLNPKKLLGYDLISGRILKELLNEGITFLTLIYNAILRNKSFPLQWKVTQIVMIQKPGKNPDDAKAYRPIGLLPKSSKIFEKLLLTRLMPIIIEKQFIPPHQFGFRQKHSTIEQVHRIVKKINNEMEAKKYCSAAFIDISQVFDKVWHFHIS